MNRKNFLLGFCAIAGFTLGMGQAQAKPNFTGDWKLNSEKSDFGPMPAPDKLSTKVDHTEPDLKVHTAMASAQGDMEWDIAYTTDGKESTATLPFGEAKSTAVWDGDAIAVTSKMNLGGNDVTIKSKWTLSEDGKTMTQMSHWTSAQGELDVKYVFEKK